MPATIVPWPSSSPVALGLSELRLTFATMREPKSWVLLVSIPLSTMAIAGRFPPTVSDGTVSAPVASRHRVDSSMPTVATGVSGTIKRMFGLCERAVSSAPLSVAAMPLIDLNAWPMRP